MHRKQIERRMDKPTFKKYLKKAGELSDLEKKILNLSENFDVSIYIKMYQEFYDGVNEIRNSFLNESSVPISTDTETELDALDYLQGILNNNTFEELEKKKSLLFVKNVYLKSKNISYERIKKDFNAYFIELFESLNEEFKKELSELSDINIYSDPIADEDLIYQEFYDWYGPYDYIHGMRVAGTILIHSDELPEHFDRITSTIKQSFAFQQYLAVAVLCRTALEVALRDLYKKLGFTTKRTPEHNIAKEHFDKIRSATGNIYLDQFDPSPRDLRYLICRLPEFEIYKEDLDKLYGDLSRIVHGSTIVKKNKAEEFMKETYWIIHEMYLEVKKS